MNQLAENRLPGAPGDTGPGDSPGPCAPDAARFGTPPAVRDWKDGGSRPSGEPSPQGGSRRWGDGTLSGLPGGIYELNGPGHITVAYYDPELMSNGTADAGTVPVLCTARYEI